MMDGLRIGYDWLGQLALLRKTWVPHITKSAWIPVIVLGDIQPGKENIWHCSQGWYLTLIRDTSWHRRRNHQVPAHFCPCAPTQVAALHPLIIPSHQLWHVETLAIFTHLQPEIHSITHLLWACLSFKTHCTSVATTVGPLGLCYSLLPPKSLIISARAVALSTQAAFLVIWAKTKAVFPFFFGLSSKSYTKSQVKSEIWNLYGWAGPWQKCLPFSRSEISPAEADTSAPPLKVRPVCIFWRSLTQKKETHECVCKHRENGDEYGPWYKTWDWKVSNFETCDNWNPQSLKQSRHHHHLPPSKFGTIWTIYVSHFDSHWSNASKCHSMSKQPSPASTVSNPSCFGHWRLHHVPPMLRQLAWSSPKEISPWGTSGQTTSAPMVCTGPHGGLSSPSGCSISSCNGETFSWPGQSSLNDQRQPTAATNATGPISLASAPTSSSTGTACKFPRAITLHVAI